MGCASRPIEPLVVAEAAPRAALTVEQAKPLLCETVVFSDPVSGDYIKILKGTALDYKAALNECVRRDGLVVDLLTQVPGQPDTVTPPAAK
jgi:hypothetical protein